MILKTNYYFFGFSFFCLLSAQIYCMDIAPETKFKTIEFEKTLVTIGSFIAKNKFKVKARPDDRNTLLIEIDYCNNLNHILVRDG
jgi:hypothetical protein